jgi:hypothetical protein
MHHGNQVTAWVVKDRCSELCCGEDLIRMLGASPGMITTSGRGLEPVATDSTDPRRRTVPGPMWSATNASQEALELFESSHLRLQRHIIPAIPGRAGLNVCRPVPARAGACPWGP